MSLGSHIYLSGSFYNNSASFDGGMVYLIDSGTDLVADSCIWKDNHAARGVLFLSPGTTTTLNNSVAQNNTAGSGGFVYANNAKLVAWNTTLQENMASVGGALYVVHCTDRVILRSVIMTLNYGVAGAAVYCEDSVIDADALCSFGLGNYNADMTLVRGVICNSCGLSQPYSGDWNTTTCAPPPPNQVYVNPTESNSAPNCGEANRKCRTIRDGLAMAVVGEEINLDIGRYTHGLENYPIPFAVNGRVLRGFGPYTVLDGEGAASSIFTVTGIQLVYSSPFQQFRIRGHVDVAIEVQDASSLILEEMELDGSGIGGSQAISVSNANVTVLRGAIYGHSTSKVDEGTVHVEKEGRLVLVQCDIHDNSGAVGSAISCSSNGLLILNDTMLHDNQATSGGVAYVSNCSMTMSGGAVVNNRAVQGGAFFSTSRGKVSVNGVSFANNMATDLGGAIYVKGDSMMNVTHSTFDAHKAWSGGVLAVQSNASIAFSSCEFQNSRADYSGGVVYSQGNQDELIITDSIVHDAACKVSGGAVHMEQSVLRVENTKVSFSQTQMQGGGLALERGGSSIHLINVTVEQCEALYGGALAILGSDRDPDTVVLDQCRFKDNVALTNGGDILAGMEGASQLTLIQSIFEGARAAEAGGSLWLHDAEVDMEASHIQQSVAETGGCVYVRGGSLIGTDILLDQCISNKGGGLYAWNNASIALHGGMIRECSATVGGGIYTDKLQNVSLDGVQWVENEAERGGGVAIVCSGTEKNTVHLHNNTFVSNRADEGGGFLLECSNTTESPLQLSGSRCSGKDNQAQRGACVYSAHTNCDPKSVLAVEGEMENNTALLYGPDWATPAVALHFAISFPSVVSPTYFFGDIPVSLVDLYNNPVPGSGIQVVLEVVSSSAVLSGSLVTTLPDATSTFAGVLLEASVPGSQVTLQVRGVGSSILPASLTFDVASNCPSNRVLQSSPSYDNLSECVCPAYMHSPDKISCGCLPTFIDLEGVCVCPVGMQPVLDATSAYCGFCDDKSYKSTMDTQPCTPCPARSLSPDRLQCICDTETYMGSDGGCHDCPLNAQCVNGQLQPNAGYWSSDGVVFECDSEAACPGGDQVCAPHQHGFLCAECEESYVKTENGTCIQCSTTSGILLLLLYVALLLVMLAWVGRSYSNTTMGVSAAIALNFAQIAAQIHIPASVWSSIAPLFEMDVFSIGGGSCIVNQSVLARLILKLCSPLLAELLLLIVWGIRRIWIADPSEWTSRVRHTALGVLAFTYVTVTKAAASTLACRTVGDRTVLVMDASVPCMEAEHRALLVPGFLALLIFSLGFPLLLFVLLRRGERGWMGLNASHVTKPFQEEEPARSWELVLTFRRALVAIVAQVAAPIPVLRSVLMMIVLYLSTKAHTRYLPYAQTRDNREERWALDVLFFCFALEILAQPALWGVAGASVRTAMGFVVLVLMGLMLVAFALVFDALGVRKRWKRSKKEEKSASFGTEMMTGLSTME